MTIILQEGDAMPTGIITETGVLISEFRSYTMADGRTAIDCGACNAPATAGMDLGLIYGWSVDADGVIVRRD